MIEVFLPVQRDRDNFLMLREDVGWDYRNPRELYSDVNSLLMRSFINIDKPRGPSSHEVTAWVGRLLNVKKIGHGGTLDPPVSGVLTVTLNSANRLLKWLMNTDKVYVGIMKLHEAIDIKEVYNIMKEFETVIYQTPPMKSAVKRSIRKRRIYSFIPLESDSNYVLFKAHVESGTYIRKLCFDVGEAIGVGINMIELRRIRSGVFDESSTVTLNQLAYYTLVYKETGESSELTKVLNPIEEILVDKPLIIVRESAKKNLYTGASLSVRGVICISNDIKSGGEAFVCSENGELIEVVRCLRNAEDLRGIESGIVATPIRVLEPINVDAGVS